MRKPASPTYRTTNWQTYNAALKQPGSLLIWFDPEKERMAAPSGRRGRPATFSEAAIQVCFTSKAQFGLAQRWWRAGSSWTGMADQARDLLRRTVPLDGGTKLLIFLDLLTYAIWQVLAAATPPKGLRPGDHPGSCRPQVAERTRSAAAPVQTRSAAGSLGCGT
jgi:hypothetical protein